MNQIAEVAQFLEAPAVAMAVDNSTATMSILRQEKSVARGGENGEEQPREGGQESVIVEKKGEHAAVCKWTISQFSKVKARALWSRYFEVGGYDCRLLVYPKGDSQALPGYLSIYLQVTDPRGSSSSKWDCFASYRLCVVNQRDEGKSIQRDSWHRFSSKKKSHGWCDFTPSSTVLDSKGGFVVNEAVLITAEILVLHESVSFSRENELPATVGPVPEVLSGKFTWKVHNLSLFKEMIKTQKIMSPVFPAGECNLRLSVYQSSVSGVDYLSMCLESKDTEKSVLPERSCWCLFRMSVLNQRAGMNHMHRDSYGRFAADNKSGDNTSLGWNDYMKMADFVAPEMGYLVDDTAVFSASFHVIKESSTFSKNLGPVGGRASAKKSDGYQGKFMWRIENFTRLKDLLKKRKITGLCIKSRRFQVGNRDCRLIVYPRGQSQPPCHLSMFLEVTDPRNTAADWSCFVSHRLSVVNQRSDERSVTKESQNRYSKAAKDWGWREFVTLTSLFDQDSGFLVQDMVVFSAEVLILKETSTMLELPEYEVDPSSSASVNETGRIMNRGTFTWRVENFLAFKEIMETRKIFSKFFQAGGCELRIGVYESFDTLCIYLESDQSIGADPDRNFWVRYRMAVVNQKHADRTVWKESSICTKTWNNSVLQFMKVSDMVEPDAGFLVRDTVVFVCEILDCCPWFEFSDLEVLISDDEQDALSTDPDELLDSDDSDGISGDEEDIFRSLLARAGFHLSYGDNPPLLLDPSQLQITLREKLLMDAGAVAAFLAGLRVYLDDPAKVKRLLLPTKVSPVNPAGGKNAGSKGEATSPSLMNLLMGVKVLQQAIVDLLLDIMVECCQPSDGKKSTEFAEVKVRGLSEVTPAPSKSGVDWRGGGGSGGAALDTRENGVNLVDQRLEIGLDGVAGAQAVQSSDSSALDGPVGRAAAVPVPQQHTEPSAQEPSAAENANHSHKPKWPEQSDELLGLIVNSLRALDGAVPQGCPEPRRRPQSAQKIALVLEKAPKHLQPDLIALVPKLVDLSEHSLAAYALLERLQKPDSETALRLPVLGALSQMEVGSDVWEQVLQQALELLPDSTDEPLAAVMSFVFKAAAECQQLPRAAMAVRGRLKKLGPAVSPRVLDVVRSTICSRTDVAEALLRDIDTDCECSENDISSPAPALVFVDRDGGGAAEHLQAAAAEQVAAACWRVADVDILVEMLTVPSLRMEAQRVFERAIARGAFGEQSVVMVLERRRSQRLIMDSRCTTGAAQAPDSLIPGAVSLSLPDDDDDFPAVLGLAEALALSRDTRVREFVSTLYAVMFKVYGDEGYRERMLRGLVERATSSTSGPHEVELGMDILTFLVREEEGTARPVLSMMRETADLANAERNALWQQLRTSEEEINRARTDRQGEINRLVRDKTSLSQRLTEADAAQVRLKGEMKSEVERLGREKKDLAERFREAENQLEWVRSERDEEIAKLANEKKSLQDRLRESDSQLAQLKSRKRDELKRVMKEKNVLAERLKSAESARKRFDEELKRFATETVTREEVRQSLEDEVRRLTQTVGQTEGGLREKEEQVMRCEAYIDGMEAKLHACQDYIQTLEGSLQEEMSRHAPLYGAGLEALSMSELETLARIHDEGLRQVRTLQQRRQGGGELLVVNMDSLGNHSPLPPPLGMYGTPPPMALGMPSAIPNGVNVHGNGHLNGTVGPWYPPP
ncbi:hypothetical protein MPTK1_8g09710 [Marchantia polymorpha subsp. ruderalis]|uniref:MATH domain-containing protein n=1 Tax=Marchantia polymorpha TaxID=3197 RepID=A0A2R6XN19_MARPO|nr:hypothetical protein MARPO_0008s0250 [Marchantia polymorpha]BBN19328.1 hypothetical protein Mp_8g09710 [Marchantia polymorpha subsp. ruderalis]|eukprot:PTQ47505.1 hypothetical protein MARPO_0008s0250 [Marchantia polymorpha]